MYFYYGFEDAVVRSEYTGKDVVFYVKFQGEPEFRAEKGSGIVTEALMVPVTISKDDYDNF